MPGPLSATVNATPPPRSSARRSTRPPFGAWRIALAARFWSACSSRKRSPYAISAPGASAVARSDTHLSRAKPERDRLQFFQSPMCGTENEDRGQRRAHEEQSEARGQQRRAQSLDPRFRDDGHGSNDFSTDDDRGRVIRI